jgi:anthranilate synthase component 1
VIVRRLDARCSLLALQRARPARWPCLLESATTGNARARYDLLLGFPTAALRLDDLATGPDFLAQLDACWRAERVAPGDDALPFRGGWALYLGYELAQQIEPRLSFPPFARLTTGRPGAGREPGDFVLDAAPEVAGCPPAREGRMPVALALRCPVALVRDHADGSLSIVAEPDHESAIAEILRDLDMAQHAPAPIELDHLEEDEPRRFLDGVRCILDYIAAGDVFQVNLSRGWRARTRAAPGDVYAALRRANPAPFAGCFVHEDWAVISSSPERLVSVHGECVQTRPIAGTRPRFVGDDDAARVRELIGHPKERAEHIMLIDLERNDLGRVCVPGSVEVDELMTVESYAHVHHIVSNVRGRLQAGATPGEVIRAVFPGGTITGCPKVRCMEIIAELEGVQRGPYTGAIGYLNRDGDLDLNILIRTLWMQGDTLSFRAGAGIVVDSDPQAELAETRAKARGLLRALGVAG